MSKIKINVYSKLNNKENNIDLNAIIIDNKIKFKDKDIFIIDLKNKTLLKDNKESLIELNFIKNKAIILVKSMNLEFKKDIKVIKLEIKDNYFYVKYLLIDENIYNEYCIKFI